MTKQRERHRTKKLSPVPPARDGPRYARDLNGQHTPRLIEAVFGASSDEAVAEAREGPHCSYMRRVKQLIDTNAIFEKVELELSLACNRRCTYCPLSTDKRQNHRAAKNSTMARPLYDLLISQLAQISFGGALAFHFYNEPLLFKRLEEYVAVARDLLPETTRLIYTNGDYLTIDRFQSLRRAGVTIFYITRHDNAIPDHLHDVILHREVILDFRSDMAMNNRGGLLGPPVDDRIRTLPCIFSAEAVVVTIDGNVLPCSCDFQEREILGNIGENHLAEIFNSERARRFRSDLLHGRRDRYGICRDCDFYADVLELPSAADLHRTLDQPLARES